MLLRGNNVFCSYSTASLLFVVGWLPVDALFIDRNCTYLHKNMMKYAWSAVNCENKYSDAACSSLYGGSVISDATNERPALCYSIGGEGSEELKRIAITTCPKTCGYCCLTHEYKCKNAPLPRVKCEAVSRRQCEDPAWMPILAEDCPNICGFCTAGGCVDKAVECENDLNICKSIKMQEFAKTHCRRTCGFCKPSIQGTDSNSNSDRVVSISPWGGTNVCRDMNNHCASWAAQGFCFSPFYTKKYKKMHCAATCNLC